MMIALCVSPLCDIRKPHNGRDCFLSTSIGLLANIHCTYRSGIFLPHSLLTERRYILLGRIVASKHISPGPTNSEVSAVGPG